MIKRFFAGRINRRNWVYRLLSSIGILFLVLAVIGNLAENTSSSLIFIVYSIFPISLLIFNISLHIRRLHDIGKSGWLLLLLLLPIVNIFGFLYMALKSGENKDNKYGVRPMGKINFPRQILGFD